MSVGAAEEAGIREEEAGGVFFLSYRFERGAIISRGVTCRSQTRGSSAQKSAQHGEVPRGNPPLERYSEVAGNQNTQCNDG